jgi:hypothetical protein
MTIFTLYRSRIRKHIDGLNSSSQQQHPSSVSCSNRQKLSEHGKQGLEATLICLKYEISRLCNGRRK